MNVSIEKPLQANVIIWYCTSILTELDGTFNVLRDICEGWMKSSLIDYEYGSAFDLAVDCVHSLGLTNEDYNWQIPEYAIILAEELMGKD